jgi:hypothetical protein
MNKPFSKLTNAQTQKIFGFEGLSLNLAKEKVNIVAAVTYQYSKNPRPLIKNYLSVVVDRHAGHIKGETGEELRFRKNVLIKRILDQLGAA